MTHALRGFESLPLLHSFPAPLPERFRPPFPALYHPPPSAPDHRPKSIRLSKGIGNFPGSNNCQTIAKQLPNDCQTTESNWRKPLRRDQAASQRCMTRRAEHATSSDQARLVSVPMMMYTSDGPRSRRIRLLAPAMMASAA